MKLRSIHSNLIADNTAKKPTEIINDSLRIKQSSYSGILFAVLFIVHNPSLYFEDCDKLLSIILHVSIQSIPLILSPKDMRTYMLLLR